MERRSRIALSNSTQSYVAHLRKNHHILLLGKWNVLILTEKELELVEEATKYHLYIVGVSPIKRCCGIVALDGGWNLFCSGADPSISAQAGVWEFSQALSCQCVRSDSFGSRACMLKLEVKDRSLCLLQVYAPDAVSEYQAFVDGLSDALQRVWSTESTIFFGTINATLEPTMKHGKA